MPATGVFDWSDALAERDEDTGGARHGVTAAMAAPALAALMGVHDDAVLLVSAHGAVLAGNPALYALCGLSHGAPAPTQVTELAEYLMLRTPDGAELTVDEWPLAAALAGRTMVDLALRLQPVGAAADVMVRCAAAPFEVDGQVAGAVMTIREADAWGHEHVALEESRAALRTLVADRERVQAEERRRIARDLHDDLQQSLAALNMRLGVAEELVEEDPAAALVWLQESQRTVIEAAKSTRRIIDDLRPQGLYHRALVTALTELVEGFSERTALPCTFATVPTVIPEPPEEVADCLYRIAQESLTNVAKHAGATKVDMRLEATGDGGMRLRVIDDGRGLDEPTAHFGDGGYGIIGMKERVLALNGHMGITSTPGVGTTVEADIPPPSRHR